MGETEVKPARSLQTYRWHWTGEGSGGYAHATDVLRREAHVIFQCPACGYFVQLASAERKANREQRASIEPGDACMSKRCSGRRYKKQKFANRQYSWIRRLLDENATLILAPSLRRAPTRSHLSIIAICHTIERVQNMLHTSFGL